MVKRIIRKVILWAMPVEFLQDLLNQHSIQKNRVVVTNSKGTPGVQKPFDDSRITLKENIRIAPSAKVQVRFGGEIFIDEHTELQDGVLVLTYGGKIKIGKNCSINPYTIIYGHGGTTIGDNVLIAGHCMIIPNTHKFADPNIPINAQGNKSIGITIEDDVWIAHGCSILDGVTIGKGAIIAAGSVVNKSVEPYTIVGGVPAVKLKNRADGYTNN